MSSVAGSRTLSALHIAVRAHPLSLGTLSPCYADTWEPCGANYVDTWVPTLLQLGADATLRTQDKAYPFYSLLQHSSVHSKRDRDGDNKLSYPLWSNQRSLIDTAWVQMLTQASPDTSHTPLEAMLENLFHTTLENISKYDEHDDESDGHLRLSCGALRVPTIFKHPRFILQSVEDLWIIHGCQIISWSMMMNNVSL